MAIMRLLQPPAIITGGSAKFRGRDILRMDGEELRKFRWKEIALVFQSAMNALNPVMTIGGLKSKISGKYNLEDENDIII